MNTMNCVYIVFYYAHVHCACSCSQSQKLQRYVCMQFGCTGYLIIITEYFTRARVRYIYVAI